MMAKHLLIKANGVEALVHYVDPAVLGGEDEEGHEGVAQVVEVVLVVYPPVPVPTQFQALRFVLHRVRVRTLAVEEEPLEELHAEDAKDDEERAADQNDVSDRLQRGEQCLRGAFIVGQLPATSNCLFVYLLIASECMKEIVYLLYRG